LTNAQTFAVIAAFPRVNERSTPITLLQMTQADQNKLDKPKNVMKPTRSTRPHSLPSQNRSFGRLAIITASTACLALINSADAQTAANRQCLAVDIRDNNRIYLSTTHPSGVVDNANARQNVLDTANGGQAKRSSYGTAPGGSTWLDPRLLSCMSRLEEVYGYSYSVSEIAGASHSSGSYHYYGTAFDVYVINGSGVSSGNPYWQSYNQRCRDMGSIESLGPGYPGHDTHVHNAWGTGSGINVAPPPGSPNCSGSFSGPDAVSWGPNRIDVVARGTDNAIYRKVYTSSGWGPFNSIGGNASSGPSIASWGTSRLDIFCRGTDNSLMHRAMTPEGWQPWHSLGQNLEAAPDAVSWGQGRIDVVIRVSNNNIMHRAYHNNNWDSWQNMGGGNVASAPSICSWDSGRLDVFYRSTNNELWHQGYNSSGWLGWQNLNGNIRGGPDAVSWGPGRIDVVVRGPNNDILHRAYHDGAWDSWQNLGGNSASDPTISSWDSGRLDVFYVSPAGELWHRGYNSSGWQPWQNLGGNLK
jgi:hypothetical protein